MVEGLQRLEITFRRQGSSSFYNQDEAEATQQAQGDVKSSTAEPTMERSQSIGGMSYQTVKI
ncbi:hypothetical protein DVH24_006116 [Malus domestica]|uniref:Uncharacterized protein n=1 Tax=Malus domestica TaxID=3750 RepID=A0A498J0P8_MALDO|nr:hypothetical protein DVH24_006116 [Malus domestica]